MSGFQIDPVTGERIYVADAPIEDTPSRGPPLVIGDTWVIDFLAGPNTQVLSRNPLPRPPLRAPRKSRRRFYR